MEQAEQLRLEGVIESIIFHSEETGFTVMEIAVMVGYSSNATFTRAFHSITGMTPKAYRECACRRQTG